MKKYFYILLLSLLGSITGVYSQSMIITGGNDHGIALCSKGQIYAWGYNDGNRLCLSNASDAAMKIVPYPSLVNTGGLTFSQLSGGSGAHSVALSCKRLVYCWGENKQMQCGRPASDHITGGMPVPVYHGEAPGYDEEGNPGGDYLGNVKYISATTAASMAILDDGTGRVVIWGGNMNDNVGVLDIPSFEPVFIRDANGDPIENVIHITGGDDNIMMIIGDSPDAKVGTVYSIGNWNGRGGKVDAKSHIAAPVEIGDGTGEFSSGKYLTNVRNCGISDVGAFAVDGTTGYVYGWGNSWGCQNGIMNSKTTGYAEKVVAGEYKSISTEAYLTNVTQVIGGNGNGTAVTEDGYVLYWGCNDAADGGFSGGVIPNSTYKSEPNTCATGPVFSNYCAGEKGPTEVRVDDAVAIARGDLYGFMVNKLGDFYVWGSTGSPGLKDHVGALGTGNVKEVSTCFKKIDIQCTPQDLCPEAFMASPRYKCPGELDSLYSGFTPLLGSEDNYYYKWTKDGVVLNTSNSTDVLAIRKADPYNKSTIEIINSGIYRVDIYYVGLNVPCDNCPDAYAEVTVIDMEMPIDTIVQTSCVAIPEKPSSSDVICYEYKVNNKFYSVGDNTTWIVYNDKEKGNPLDTLDVTVGDAGSFCVSGDNVVFNDNAPVDTTYSIYVEDATKLSGIFFEKLIETEENTGQLSSTQPFYMYVEVRSDVVIESAKIAALLGWNAVSGTITPVVYKVDLNQQGEPICGEIYKKGNAAPFSIPDCKTDPSLQGQIVEMTLDFGNLKLEGNSVRGASYFIFFEASDNMNDTYVFTDLAPFVDEIDGASLFVQQVGQANSTTNFSNNGYHAIYDLKYSKLTSYNCGRIELQSRYWCPPCNRPDAKASGKYVEIESTQEPVSDTIRLCKESADVTLSVTDVKNTTVTDASFDILWFDNEADMINEASALKSELTGTATSSSLDVSWGDITAGTTKTYYVKVRDHEKNTAAACFVFDSIKIKSDTVPVVPEIEIDPFCEGSLSSLEIAAMAAKFTFKGLSSQVKNAAGTELTPALLLADLSSLTAGTHTYTVTVTDDATGCVSESKEITIEVWANPSETLVSTDPFCEGVSKTLPSSANSYTVKWYTDALASSVAETNLSSLAGKTTDYEYYYTVTDANGCISDTTLYSFTIMPIADVAFDTTMVCGKTTVTSKNVVPTGADLVWTLAGSPVSTTEFSEPTYVGDLGELAVYAKSTGYCNSDTVSMAELHVKSVPTAPEGTKTVTYLLSDAVNGSFKDLLTQNSAAVTMDADYTYNWFSSEGTSLGTTVPTPDVPASSVTEDQKLTYTVTRTNADGCESDPMTVTVTIYLTPAPSTVPVEYCLNTTTATPLTATINDPNGTNDFELQWYDTDKKTKIEAPTPDVTKVGETTYYVSQISSAGAESSLVPLTVTVYGVAQPTLAATNVLKYCSDDQATALMATLNSDASTYMMGDKLVWTMEGSSISDPTPNTSVSTTTTYKYGVSQTYTIASSSEVCEGDASTFEVKVTKVDAVKTADVLYLKADAVNGTFSKNIMEQNTSAVTDQVTGSTLNWYDSDCTTPISGTPTPNVDASKPEGEDQKVTYCVSQTVDGCESAKEQITVVISDAPVPAVKNLSYCQGETAAELTATINTMVSAADNYDLLWYDSDNNKLNGAPVPETTMRAGETQKSEYVYYVTQKNKITNAESSKAKITVTVYAIPTLSITDPSAVCETTVDLTKAVTQTNEIASMSYDKGYYSDEAGTVSQNTTVGVSGTYYVQYAYDVNSATGAVCKSAIEAIKVTVDTLTATSADVTTCPNMTATFTAKAETNAGTPSYTWTGSGDAGVGSEFVTKAFINSNDGDEFVYTLEVTAGTCKETGTYKVTLGEGPVVGSLTLADADNQETPSITYTNDVINEPYYFCGGDVTLTTTYEKNSDTDYTLLSANGQTQTGSTFTIGDAGIYTLSFNNRCPTKVEFEIKDASIKISHVEPQKNVMCEGETFTSKLNVTHASDYTTAWYKDGAEITGAVGDEYTINATAKGDAGQYKAVSTSHGCVSEDEVGELEVKTYIQYKIETAPYIVTRGEDVEIPITITEPASGTINSISWKENGVETYNGATNVLTVTSDHNFDILMSDPNHCDAQTTAEVLVDAKLVLTTDFADTLCHGESRTFTIDTTGTGAFLKGACTLKVTELQNGVMTDVTNKFTLSGGKLTADLSPTKDATYAVEFTYDTQNESATESIIVLQPIEIVDADIHTVCEGTEVEIALKDVKPEGTTIKWDADPTITSGLEGESITVTSVYPGGSSHRGTYIYKYTASYAGCEDKPMTAQLIVDEPLSGTVVGTTPICEAASTTLDASSFDAESYIWTLEDGGSDAKTGSSITATLYTSSVFKVDMTRGECTKDTTFAVEVTSLPVIVSVDSVGFTSRQIIVDGTYGTAPFQYAVDNVSSLVSDNVIGDLKYTSHIAYVVDAVGCIAKYPFIMETPAITPSAFITPNGDGSHDLWEVVNLKEAYPDAVVRIYDRFGKKLVEYKGSADSWDGTYDGKEMPSTDYWYEIEIEEINKTYVGHFTLLRR